MEILMRKQFKHCSWSGIIKTILTHRLSTDLGKKISASTHT